MTEPSAPPESTLAADLGLGCFTTIAGAGGGYMIAVLVAKIVGGFTRCASDAETGAPCNFFTYGMFGVVIGAVLLPTVVLTVRRRSRRRLSDLKRG
jgi:hypothetical protein